jgi:Zn-dependent protease
MDPSNVVWRAAVWIIPLVIAIVFHEVAHGYVAWLLGDRTARDQRRLSLNPLRHVDPIGTIGLPLLLALAKAPVFGWARPVPVNPRHLRNPRTGMMLVAIAGPATNLLLALVAALALGVTTAWSGGQLPGTGLGAFLVANLFNFLLINVFLALFNLLPLPPFDGGHIVQGLLPRPLAARWGRMARYAFPAAILLLVVLPMLAPNLNIVQRVVLPPVDAMVNLYLSIADAIA